MLGPDRKHFYRLDGYYVDPDTYEHVVLSYHGCFWHQCPDCTDTPGDKYLNTMFREKYLRESGYKVITMWQHDFSNL